MTVPGKSNKAVELLQQFGQGLPCPFCFGDGLHLRFDKRGRPYTYCSQCQTRSFISVSIALKWVAYVAPQLILNLAGQGAFQSFGSVPAVSQAQGDQFVAEAGGS